jgi:hypothetical protein
MALKQLDPAPTTPLAEGWQLIASEAGRSNRGLCATIGLFNGTAQGFQTLAVGDVAAQAALSAAFAPVVGLEPAEVTHALMQLIAAIEGILRQMDTHGQEEDLTQATALVHLALGAGAELFHSPEGLAYATIDVEGHTETWLLKVQGFRRWLARLFYDEKQKAPGSQALQDALNVLEGKALYDGLEWPVYTRLAAHEGAIYLDLANERWQAVQITATGWQVIDAPPVKFRRTRGMLPLPDPGRGGTLAALRPFVNVGGIADWRLVVAWLLMTLRPSGPYPILVVYGEHGSTKSTMVRVLRALVDPNVAGLRTTPREERDLAIAAHNSWIVAFDNLSHMPDWFADALCRLSTGLGYATRELFSDLDEIILHMQRPVVVNGIEEIAVRGDFLDRALIVYLPVLPEHKRQGERVFWETFERERPQILGALLDIVSGALQRLPSMTLDRTPRMADFALWACAAAEACGWTADDFLDAYAGVRDAVHELTLEASIVGPLLRDFVDHHYAGQPSAGPQQPWVGTSSELLTALETRGQEGPLAGKDLSRQKAWPKNGRALSNSLRRLTPTLRAVGVHVEFHREPGTGKRTLAVSRQATPPPPGRVQGSL